MGGRHPVAPGPRAGACMRGRARINRREPGLGPGCCLEVIAPDPAQPEPEHPRPPFDLTIRRAAHPAGGGSRVSIAYVARTLVGRSGRWPIGSAPAAGSCGRCGAATFPGGWLPPQKQDLGNMIPPMIQWDGPPPGCRIRVRLLRWNANIRRWTLCAPPWPNAVWTTRWWCASALILGCWRMSVGRMGGRSCCPASDAGRCMEGGKRRRGIGPHGRAACGRPRRPCLCHGFGASGSRGRGCRRGLRAGPRRPSALAPPCPRQGGGRLSSPDSRTKPLREGDTGGPAIRKMSGPWCPAASLLATPRGWRAMQPGHGSYGADPRRPAQLALRRRRCSPLAARGFLLSAPAGSARRWQAEVPRRPLQPFAVSPSLR